MVCLERAVIGGVPISCEDDGLPHIFVRRTSQLFDNWEYFFIVGNTKRTSSAEVVLYIHDN